MHEKDLIKEKKNVLSLRKLFNFKILFLYILIILAKEIKKKVIKNILYI